MNQLENCRIDNKLDGTRITLAKWIRDRVKARRNGGRPQKRYWEYQDIIQEKITLFPLEAAEKVVDEKMANKLIGSTDRRSLGAPCSTAAFGIEWEERHADN